MHQPNAGRREAKSRDPSKMIVLATLVALTVVGLVGLLSAVRMAPAVVGAFVAGAATAALVTLIF